MPIINQIVKGDGSPAPAHYIEFPVDANGVMARPTTIMDFDGVKELGACALYYLYSTNTTISGAIIFNDLEWVHGNNAMYYTFNGCTGVTSFEFPRFKTMISAFMRTCDGCTSLTTVKVPSLKYIGSGSASGTFRGCILLSSIYFPAINNSSFGSNLSLNGMCTNCVNITLHFPTNVQATVEALTGYSTTAPFGATSGTVLFDLPATVILTGANSQAYERNPKDDTGTALSWRKQDTGTLSTPITDWTPYYTSGTTDPAVSDTIYSDAACTVAETTISSIA